MAMFRGTDKLVKAGDREGYYPKASKLLQRLQVYFDHSGARELGFEDAVHGLVILLNQRMYT